MPKRFSNIFSRAIERHRANQIDAAQDEAISSPDSQSARILTMPNRRSLTEKMNDEQTNAGEEAVTDLSNVSHDEQVTAENWNWSEPPKFVRSLAERGIGSGESTALSLAKDEGKRREENFFGMPSEIVGTSVEKDVAPFRAAVRPSFRVVEVKPERVEPHLVAITKPRSAYCEEFRNLRTRILHASQQQKLQAITIASGSPSEGKSTVALNLAWLLAQTDGVSALIIDSDLRLPCLADYLDVESQPGLSEIFSNEARLEDAIIKLEPSGLHLLPGGAARDDVAEMLSGNKFRLILEQTRKMFDYIIVDAPSLGIFTDAAVLINQTDAALLVVRAGKTRYSTTNRLLETLPRERMLGVVLNGSDENWADESHYDSHYYQNRRKIETKNEVLSLNAEQ